MHYSMIIIEDPSYFKLFTEREMRDVTFVIYMFRSWHSNLILELYSKIVVDA